MIAGSAFAKLNLALVVGPVRPDGKHEVVTVLQAVDLADELSLERADALAVEGFAEDTLVRAALERLARAAGTAPDWHVRIEKRIPVAAGLGGGSSDAATSLLLANSLLAEPVPAAELQALAAEIGADVPFFLSEGPRLATGDGSELSPVDLPQEYVVVLVLPAGVEKDSTAAVYQRFDERKGARGFEQRVATLRAALAGARDPADLARLPSNDLASSPLAKELEARGAFRADVTGAGPVVYGLFERGEDAERALAALPRVERSWLVRPASRR